MTKEEREASTARLQEKLDKLRAAIEERAISEPDQSVVAEFLEKKDISATWEMLERARGRAPAGTKEIWDGLKELGKPAAAKVRWETLMAFVQGNDWSGHLVKALDTIVRPCSPDSH